MDPVAEFLGPIFVGNALNCMMFGITVCQTLFYYKSYTADLFTLKALVGVICALDFVHVYCVTDALYNYMVRGRGNVPGLAYDPITFRILLGTSYSIGLLVECFFAWRVYQLSRGKVFITGTIVSLSLLQFGTGIALLSGFTKQLISLQETRSHRFAGIELGSSVACDLLIAATLAYLLHQGKTGLKSTEGVLNRLIKYSVNIGLLTSTAASANLLLYLVLPNGWQFVPFLLLTSKFYANSFLATLNSRRSIEEGWLSSRKRPLFGRTDNGVTVTTGIDEFSLRTIP